MKCEIDRKSFEISVESVKGKLRGRIEERCGDLLSWIRLSERSIGLLCKVLLAGSRDTIRGRLLLEWKDEGRYIRVERKRNRGGDYLLCIVWDSDLSMHAIAIPEGRPRGSA